MRDYVIRRLLLVPVSLLLVSFLVFAMSRMIPGDIVDIMYQEKGYAKDLQEMREKLGLTKPIYAQYFSWVGGILKGDWGISLWNSEPVIKEISKRWPVTLELGVLALIIAMIVAIPIGIFSAIRQDSFLDYALRSYSITMLSLPGFWLALMIILVPTIWFPNWRGAPPFVPFSEAPWANLKMMIIPAFCLGHALSGTTMRMVRTMMLEVLRQDYIRTARAKGLREQLTITRHALKNAMIPVLTHIGAQMMILVGGSVIIEEIFGLPGLGRHMFHSIMQRDYPLVSGINLVLAATIVFLNLFIDIAYAYIDPRIRYR